MNLQKVEKVLELVNQFLLPLAKQGVQATKNVEDDMVVALFEGGIPAVIKKLQDLEDLQDVKTPTPPIVK